MSLVDLNRSGVALMEIVTKPDLRSADEAKAFIGKLRNVLRYLGTCDGDMEKGNLRADVNVSVRKPGAELGTRCEIKNVNSIRFIGQAIDYEAWRQIGIIEDGGTIEQETRLFDPDKGETRSMRSKEEAHDYRYFPDPDLLPLELSPALVEELRRDLPELPDEQEGALSCATTRSPPTTPMCWWPRREMADFFERHGRRRRHRSGAARSQARGQLGDQRTFEPAPSRTGMDIAAGGRRFSAAHARRSRCQCCDTPDRRRPHHFRQDAKEVFEWSGRPEGRTDK